MEPADPQEQYVGYSSSLLFQPEWYKYPTFNNMHPAFILSSSNTGQGLMGFTQQHANELHDAEVKEEMADSFAQLNETTEKSSSLSTRDQLFNDFGEYNNHLLFNSPSFSSGRHQHRHTISSFDHSYSSLVTSTLDLDIQALDLLISSQNTCGYNYFMEQLKDSSSSSSNKVSNIEDGINRKRKHSISSQEAKNFQVEVKKQKPPLQPSCPPSKVQKEKQREKIATLQRLVSPYGKTDTTSVLTDVIGYIQFLHNQVQTLSAPYIRSPKCDPTRAINANLSEEDMKGQPKRDLRCRGLCLVPVSYASFFNSYNCGI